MAFERMLMAGCLPVCGTVLTWGLAASAGMAAAPYYLAALLCLMYYLFILPLPPSFHLRGGARRPSLGGGGSGDKGAPVLQGGRAGGAMRRAHSTVSRWFASLPAH